MADWRTSILQEFVPQVAPLTLVADPDGLLLEEKMLSIIRNRGFEILEYDDPIEFRFKLSLMRANTDSDGYDRCAEIVVVCQRLNENFNLLPYDLLDTGRQLRFDLGSLFPNLSYPVLTLLNRADLDALFQAQQRYKPGHLGDNGTKEFALRHVFEIAPELIKEPSDLLCVLLKRYHKTHRIPSVINERFIEILRERSVFQDWPLETIIPDGEAFLRFLQERWPIFLENVTVQAGEMMKEPQPYNCRIKGPKDLPFDHDDVRLYVDRLFLNGLLSPVSVSDLNVLEKSWVRIGIRQDPVSDRRNRFDGLATTLASEIPQDRTNHDDWIKFGFRWAELTALKATLGNNLSEMQIECYANTQKAVDQAFGQWLQLRYAGLHYLPVDPPVMLHHVPRTIARQIEKGTLTKAALVVVDGLSLDQWITLRDALICQRAGITTSEHAVFAWVPTITAVSRQAIFSGKAPMFFPSSIYTTDKEPSLWAQFWADHEMKQQNVGYVKSLGDGDLSRVNELMVNSEIRVLGLVVDTVDSIMHGMKLGNAGMHSLIRQWVEKGFLVSLIALLLAHGFRIYLTSDHGNVESVGCGRPAEGSVADLRGERVRVYSRTVLRDSVHNQYPDTIEWPTWGLPTDYLPLIASNRKAFVKEGDQIVCHGGTSIEEVLVPFIEIDEAAI